MEPLTTQKKQKQKPWLQTNKFNGRGNGRIEERGTRYLPSMQRGTEGQCGINTWRRRLGVAVESREHGFT